MAQNDSFLFFKIQHSFYSGKLQLVWDTTSYWQNPSSCPCQSHTPTHLSPHLSLSRHNPAPYFQNAKAFFSALALAMYGIPAKGRDMGYGSTYTGEIGDVVWSTYLAPIELADEKACLELISLLIGFLSTTPPGRDLLSQVSLALLKCSLKLF